MDVRQLLDEAEALLHRHQATDAMERLHQALHFLLQRETADSQAEIRCLLLLARAHHLREDLATARLYTDEAAAALAQAIHLPDSTQAEIYLGLARLAPDVGRLRVGLVWAREAQRLFSALHLPGRTLDALHLAAVMANQLGRFPEARAYLDQAARLLSGLDNPERSQAQVRLLNTEAHHAWYRGHLVQALERARQAQELADAVGLAKQQLYTRLLTANLLRELGRYPEAEAGYAALERRLDESGFQGFRIWLQAHRGWLAARQGRFHQAREHLFQALAVADPGQAASVQVFLAGVYILTDRPRDALDLLLSSLRFYQTSGDELSIFALHIHLAGAYLRLEQPARAEEHLALALEWAIRRNVDYFPHWWHPDLVAPALVHGLVVGVHPGMAERILVTRVGPAAGKALRPLLAHPDPTVARRARDAWQLLGPGQAPLLEDLAPEVRAVLEELVAEGFLRLEGLDPLARLLSGSPGGEMANPVHVAVCVLYLRGADRREIAARLGRAEATVRNYITLVYERFGLAAWRGSRKARRAELLRRAVAQGFVSPG